MHRARSQKALCGPVDDLHRPGNVRVGVRHALRKSDGPRVVRMRGLLWSIRSYFTTCGAPSEIRETLRDKGIAMAAASIHFALSQLQARRAVEQVADTKTWRYLGKAE